MMNNDKKIEKRFKNQATSKTFQNIIKTFNLKNKTVLDIGCSYGEHLVHFKSNSIGLTLKKEEADYGNNRGLNIKYGNIESDNLDIPENNFDIIFANNLFEHLLSPHIFLCKIQKYLKEDGLLILGVPCIPQINFLRHFKKFKGYLAITHVSFFTKDTLIKTVERGGWDIINTRGFHFKNKFIDKLLDLIYPHFYVIAKPHSDFRYYDKRKDGLSDSIKIN